MRKMPAFCCVVLEFLNVIQISIKLHNFLQSLKSFHIWTSSELKTSVSFCYVIHLSANKHQLSLEFR
jgi:hypothetical protein